MDFIVSLSFCHFNDSLSQGKTINHLFYILGLFLGNSFQLVLENPLYRKTLKTFVAYDKKYIIIPLFLFSFLPHNIIVKHILQLKGEKLSHYFQSKNLKSKYQATYSNGATILFYNKDDEFQSGYSKHLTEGGKKSSV